MPARRTPSIDQELGHNDVVPASRSAVRAVLGALALGAVVLGARDAAAISMERYVRRALDEATVSLETGCSGALAEHSQLIVTALHCVDDAGQHVMVRLSNGERRRAWIVDTDAVADQAVLFMEEKVALQPLDVVRRPQIAGTIVYFSGHPDRPRFQRARLDRVGVCRSLPKLPNALFTTIEGTPGDSGAPIVDGAGRIVGLVHGGVSCHIATPATTLAPMIAEILAPSPSTPRAVRWRTDPPAAASPLACRAR